MAQTKTKPKKRSTGGTKRRSASGKASTKAKSQSKPKPKSKSKSRSRSTGSSSRSKSSATKRTGGSGGKSSRGGSGKGRSSLERAKGPATVAGAALLAVAGGLAASKNGSKGGLLTGGRGKRGLPSPKSGLKSLKKIDISKIDLPKPEEAIDWVEEKAKGVGDAGYRVAELSSQAHAVRKAVSGGK